MAGMEIVLRDKNGKIKQDLKVSMTNVSGKVVEIDKLKEKEKKKRK